jgi:signal transduction histidine kinase
VPECVEVAAYYLVSEALTNAAKHSKASVVRIEVATEKGVILLAICDDGIGGADATQGSGLIGLSDRVEALSGTIEVSSPADGGTAIRVTMPDVPMDDGEWEPPDRVGAARGCSVGACC